MEKNTNCSTRVPHFDFICVASCPRPLGRHYGVAQLLPAAACSCCLRIPGVLRCSRAARGHAGKGCRYERGGRGQRTSNCGGAACQIACPSLEPDPSPHRRSQRQIRCSHRRSSSQPGCSRAARSASLSDLRFELRVGRRGERFATTAAAKAAPEGPSPAQERSFLREAWLLVSPAVDLCRSFSVFAADGEPKP